MRSLFIVLGLLSTACLIDVPPVGEGEGEGEGEEEFIIEAACDRAEAAYTFNTELSALDFGAVTTSGDIRVVVDNSRTSVLLEATGPVLVVDDDDQSAVDGDAESLRFTTPADIVELGLTSTSGDVCIGAVEGTVAVDSGAGLLEAFIPDDNSRWGLSSSGDTLVHAPTGVDLLAEANEVRVDAALGCDVIGGSTVTCGTPQDANVVIDVNNANLELRARP